MSKPLNRAFGGLVAVTLFAVFSIGIVQASINTSLDFGESGANVTELQRYLALNPSIYPEGLVTGYYGPLTRAAVERFQTAQSIVSAGTPETTGYGRVGPITMMRINSLMASAGNTGGGGVQASWDQSPVLTLPVVQSSNTSATVAWSSNEPTQGQVYLSTMPFQLSEATGPRQQPYVSGNLTTDNNGLQTNHNVTLSNLSSNTTYYYLVRGIDNVGNLSMVWPSTFRTGN